MRSWGDQRELATRSVPGAHGRPSPGAARTSSWHEPRDLDHGLPSGRPLTIYVSHPSVCLTDHLPHGDGLIAYEFISRLAGRGHTVHVAAPRVEVAGPLPESLVLHPYQVHAPRPSLAPLATMLHVRRIIRELARLRMPDVIHQWNPVEPGLSVLVSGMGVPLVLGPLEPDWPHEGSPPARRRGPLGLARGATAALVARADHVQMRRAAALLLSTPAAAARLPARLRGADTVRMLPYGVDTKRFSPPTDAVPGPPRILFLANLYARKGIYTLLEAFRVISDAMAQCELCIGGTGPELPRVLKTVGAMASRSRITVLGAVDRSRVPEVMRSATVYCLPSHGEPFGASALEAMSCGRPVVVTDAGGLRHLVDAAGGRRVPVGDSHRLAAALLEIVRAPKLAEGMGRHNRSRAVREYDWDVLVDQLEAVYREVIATRLRRRRGAGGRAPEPAVVQR